MSSIPYTFTRASLAALINPLGESRIVQTGVPVVGYPGVRGGGGYLIMPGVTQLFKDNYFSNQTVDAAVGAPWTIAGAVTARAAYALLGGRSAQVDATAGTAALWITYQTSAVHTLSCFVYIPPPARLRDASLRLRFYAGNGVTTYEPDQYVSLGGYWYLAYVTKTGQNSADDRWGIHSSSPAPPFWVDCLSLTQTAAPVGFIPNSSTSATYASADDVLKYTLDRPLPASGSVSLTFIPFANDDAFVSAAGILVGFVPSGGNSGTGTDYFLVGRNASGIYVTARTTGWAAETTACALNDFKAFNPMDLVITWDFSPGGTKRVNIFANGHLKVESSVITKVSANLVDTWVGCERTGASSWSNHAQGIIQDVMIHRRG